MPSAEETTYLIEVMPDSNISQDSFTSHDVDVLVSRIKENLRLSSLKSRSSLASSHRLRASPYRLPSRSSWPDDEPDVHCEPCCSAPASRAMPGSESEHHRQVRKAHHHQLYRRCRIDDSYERFQALLRSGALIKEAVKRLQTCPDDELDEDSSGAGSGKRRATSTSATSATLDSMDEEDEEEDLDDFVLRRKHFNYDSEDDVPLNVEA